MQVYAAVDAADEDSAKAITRLQAMARGRVQRGKDEEVKAVAALTKVQARVRGHLARDAQQESRRQEWLQYYAAEGDYDKALELAVSQREIDAVYAMRFQLSEPDGAASQQTCRCLGGATGAKQPVPANGGNGGNGHGLTN